jgi:hypothetical protein
MGNITQSHIMTQHEYNTLIKNIWHTIIHQEHTQQYQYTTHNLERFTDLLLRLTHDNITYTTSHDKKHNKFNVIFNLHTINHDNIRKIILTPHTETKTRISNAKLDDITK